MARSTRSEGQTPAAVLGERDILRAAVESGLDGLLVVSPEGRMLSMNHQFVEMWPIPPEVVRSGDDEAALAVAMTRLVDPEAFLARVREVYADPSGPVRDELHLRDGRVFDRYGTPLHAPSGAYLGWAWYFRDVTAERVAAEQAIQAGERFRKLARTLQESLLPPHLPEVPGLEIVARYLPGSSVVEVVGDFYDVFQTVTGGWALTIGDVCGKGVEAATVTALARYTIRAAAVTRTSPAEVLLLLNEAMRRQQPDSERFVTATYATVTHVEGAVAVRLSLAGHPPALRRRVDGSVDLIGQVGTVLGVLDAVELVDVDLLLEPGDSLVMYTDGVTEARRGKELFGEDRLRDLVSGLDGSAGSVAARIEAEVVDFSEGHQLDDTAILVIRVPPAG